jgi:hypothetical protein
VPIPFVAKIGDHPEHGQPSHLPSRRRPIAGQQPYSDELLSEHVAVLHHIRDTDVSSTEGFGPWDEHGRGRFRSSGRIHSQSDREGRYRCDV